MSCLVDITDAATGVQFAAVTVELADGTSYVAFRGTDTSIAGWKEDFSMSYQAMPSQLLAARYLSEAVAHATGQLRVGGHSKGGNLALYAAAALDDTELERICAVYSNDGPGLAPQIMPTERVERFGDRYFRIGPAFSVVGMLFSDTPPDVIVASSAPGLLQHDPMTWEVEPDGLDGQPELAPAAVDINQAIGDWLEGASHDERRQITEALFGSLSAGGAVLLQDVARNEFGSVESVLLALARSRGTLRAPARLGVRVAVRRVASLDLIAVLRSSPALLLLALGAVGVFFIRVPDLAVQVIAALALAGLLIVAGLRLSRYGLAFRQRHQLGWRYLVITAAILTLLLGAATSIGMSAVPANLLFAACFLVAAWSSARFGLARLRAQPRRAAVLFLNAIVSLLFGIVAITTADRVMSFFIVQAGQYFLVVAFVGIFLLAYDQLAASPAAAPPTRGGSAVVPT